MKSLSIKQTIILISILAMLLSMMVIGHVIFSRWLSSADRLTENISREISDRIYNQVESFMHTPGHINEANHRLMANGVLDLSDEVQRDKYFVSVLSAQHDEIYSISYGTAEGEYYGARRDLSGDIHIMRNNASTGGASWYYSVNDDLTAGEIVLQTGPFDPRTRAWYQSALVAGGPVHSPVYKHFVMDDLTISAAWPMYGSDGEPVGVLGTHMLLSDISRFLADTIKNYHGHALIIERDTGFLIANSWDRSSFATLPDGTVKRLTVDEIVHDDVLQAFKQYEMESDPHFVFDGQNDRLFVDAREVRMDGLNWVVISTIPENLYMANVVESLQYTLVFVVIALAVSFLILGVVTHRLFRPINDLMRVSEAMVAGDLSQRVSVSRPDEIGNISNSLNRVADKMQSLINNLEDNVHQRTEELHQVNNQLAESKNQLQLILDSAAEAIYGIDLNGICTFCNNSCLKMLGYVHKDDLLGKNMHRQIHHCRLDGEAIPHEECKIFQSIRQGKGVQAEDEVFWKADGTPIAIEYHSYPQIRDGEVIGGVITFMDITDRKQREEEVRYLNCHDPLTGLHNRRCFDENVTQIDTEENLPLSVVFADVNGLKMTNDIFGHTAGDELIRKSAEILMQSCRDNDIIARLGGDEFVIMLPKTSGDNAEKVIARIKAGFAKAQVEAIKCSLSLGFHTKTSADQPLEEVMGIAENAMYKDKTLNRKSVNKGMIDTIIESLHSRYPIEKQHSISVRDFCVEMGTQLGLSESEISTLKRAGYLHDIGKITLDENLLSKETLAEEELEEMQLHSVAGYRILSLFDETLDVAEYVYSHHERWDGHGYPRGLAGVEIPLISRIISIAETYDRVLNRGDQPVDVRKSAARDVIKEEAGSRFDPKIAELFNRMV